MKISGFTIGKNISKLYYPIKESITSILPIVDEFIVVLGDSDENDTTKEEILSIGSPKIRIFDSEWDIEKFRDGTELAHQTDIAKNYCTSDWLFYIQADEVVHEKYLPIIKNACENYLHDKEIEALLFKYVHFWGDYEHYHISHGWYRKEIRIIRNDSNIHSWRDAQSFRRIKNFDGFSYNQKIGTEKLNVAEVDAYIYHYGWVRPPSMMKTRKIEMNSIWFGKEAIEKRVKEDPKFLVFDYGSLKNLGKFKGTHPEVMKNWIAKLDWQKDLLLTGKPNKNRLLHKHERLRIRIITFIERFILFGKPIGEFKNYIKVK